MIHQFTWRRAYFTRFYQLTQWVDGERFDNAAVVNDFGELVIVGTQ